ncbi:MAG: tRNA (adenosine(37)-N6)-threonylcarbamoyltransferase complex dimerization subunit type 1 TsaB [Ferruginibacter sp.]
MSLILNLDTSLEIASVSIATDGVIMFTVVNDIQKEHASFLHIAIKEMLTRSSFDISQLDAIAVTHGPGSYTGLRVGMSSAKGLCYALNKPLITIGTLDAMAVSVINKTTATDILYCPMIDARRMEVYTAIYDCHMNQLLPACAMVLTTSSFESFLVKYKIIFFGNGTIKWKTIMRTDNATFLEMDNIAQAISTMAYKAFCNKQFADLRYTDPFYIKEFYAP